MEWNGEYSNSYDVSEVPRKKKTKSSFKEVLLNEYVRNKICPKITFRESTTGALSRCYFEVNYVKFCGFTFESSL